MAGWGAIKRGTLLGGAEDMGCIAETMHDAMHLAFVKRIRSKFSFAAIGELLMGHRLRAHGSVFGFAELNETHLRYVQRVVAIPLARLSGWAGNDVVVGFDDAIDGADIFGARLNIVDFYGRLGLAASCAVTRTAATSTTEIITTEWRIIVDTS
jgi:hypothetical protein